MDIKLDLDYFLTNAPNLFGEIARFINDSLDTHEPAIALASSLAFMGMLKSGRVKNKYKIAPVIYSCVVAPSGRGKTRAENIIKNICSDCLLTKHLMGEPRSDSAILVALQKEERRLLCWDEFGQAFQEMATSKNGHRSLIISQLMKLFSNAGTHTKSAEYATKDTIELQEPYLSMFAFSTPSRFYGSLTRNFVLDGWMPRILLFQAGAQPIFKEALLSSVSQNIIRQVIEIDNGKPNVSDKGNLRSVLKPETEFLKFETESNDEFYKEEQRSVLESTKDPLAQTYHFRSFELWMKVCMGVSRLDNYLLDNEAQYAWDLVNFILLESIKSIESEVHDTASDKEQDRRHKKFLSIIPNGSKISKKEFGIKSRNMGFGKNERAERLEDCLTSGIWIEEEFQTTTRKGTFYGCF